MNASLVLSDIIYLFNINYFSIHLSKISTKYISGMDRRLEGRKPIEAIRDDINELKVELIHIKNYLRKLEIREEIKEQEQSKAFDKYVILDNNRPEKENQRGWFGW
jgi:hypothetical protein